MICLMVAPIIRAEGGIAAADSSRIRNVDLARFALYRLVGIINRLGPCGEMKCEVEPAPRAGRAAITRPEIAGLGGSAARQRLAPQYHRADAEQ